MKCPESIEQLEELEEKWIPLCRKGLYEQAQARKDADPGKSERKIAKELAEEAGVPEETENIRAKIKYEKKEKSGRNLPPSQRNASEKKKSRMDEGRPPAQSGTSEEEKKKVVTVSPPPQCRIPKPAPELISAAFKVAWDKLFIEVKDAKASKWKTTSKEAALKRVDVLKDVITIS